jgi:hypothetical protein
MSDDTAIIVGFGLLIAQLYAAMKLDPPALFFAVCAAAGIGGLANVPLRAMAFGAVLAFILRYCRYSGTGR